MLETESNWDRTKQVKVSTSTNSPICPSNSLQRRSQLNKTRQILAIISCIKHQRRRFLSMHLVRHVRTTVAVALSVHSSMNTQRHAFSSSSFTTTNSKSRRDSLTAIMAGILWEIISLSSLLTSARSSSTTLRLTLTVYKLSTQRNTRHENRWGF